MSEAKKGKKLPPLLAEKKRAFLLTVCAWNKGLTASTDERVARMRARSIEAMSDSTYRDLRSRLTVDSILSGKHWKRGRHLSPKVGEVYFMSGWEERRFNDLDRDPQVVTYVVHPCVIPYSWNGRRYRYIPDILIQYENGDVVLEEIKPRNIVEVDRARKGKVTAKIEAGNEYAQAQGWIWRVFWYNS